MPLTRNQIGLAIGALALLPLAGGIDAAGPDDEDLRRKEQLEAFYGQPLTAGQIAEIAGWDVQDADWWTDPARNERARRKQAHLRYLAHNSRFTLASVTEHDELFGIRYVGPDPLNDKSVGLLHVDGGLRPDLLTLPELIEAFLKGVIGAQDLDELEPPVPAWKLKQLARWLSRDEERIRELPWLLSLDRYGLLAGTDPADRLARGAETFLRAALETLFPALYGDPAAAAQARKDENALFWAQLTNAPEADIRQAWTRLVDARDEQEAAAALERTARFLERLPSLHRRLLLKHLTGDFARTYSYAMPILDHRQALTFFEDLEESLRGRQLLAAPPATVEAPYQQLSIVPDPPLHIKKENDITDELQGKMTVYVNGSRPTISHTLRAATNQAVPPLLTVTGTAQFGAMRDGMTGAWSSGYSAICKMWDNHHWHQFNETTCTLDSGRAWERLYSNQPGWYYGGVKEGSAFTASTPEFFEESMTEAASKLDLTIEKVASAGIELKNAAGQKIRIPNVTVSTPITKTSPEQVQLCDERTPAPNKDGGEPEACFTCPEPMTVTGPGQCQCPAGTLPNLDEEGNLLDPVCIDICDAMPEVCAPPEGCTGNQSNGSSCYVDYNEIEDWPDLGWEPIPDSQISATYGSSIVTILDQIPCTITTQLIFIDVYIPYTGITIKVAVETEVLCRRTGNKQVDCSQPENWYLCEGSFTYVNGPPPGFACADEGSFQCVADGTLSQPCRRGFWRQPLACDLGCDEATGECLVSAEPCTDGETRCTADGAAAQRCTGGAWSAGVLCDQDCDPGTGLCNDTPAGSCSGDTRRCVDNDSALQYCHQGQWGFVETCPFGCDSGTLTCLGAAASQCLAGERRCSADGRSVQLCEQGSWGSTVLCAYGCDAPSATCNATAPGCPPVYTDRCEVWGRTRCSGTNVLSCEIAPNGCLTWTLVDACSQGCSNGTCNELACSGPDSCSIEDARRCPTTSTAEVCAYAADGCLRWTAPATGAVCDVAGGEVCELGLCQERTCSTSLDCFLSGAACASGLCAPCDPVANPCANGFGCNQSTGRCSLLF